MSLKTPQPRLRDGTCDTSSIPDDLLIRLAAGGDPAAFEDLYRRHRRSVNAIARRFAKDQDAADDFCQDIWIRVVRALPTFRGEARFSTWLHRVAVRASLQGCRTRQRKAGREVDLYDSQPDHTATSDVLLLRVRLGRALAQLPEGKRRVLVMFDIEGHPHEEIAQHLGITPGTSKSQLFKARAHLRHTLSGPSWPSPAEEP